MELNTRAKQILELAKKYSIEHNVHTLGTEFLILAMYQTEDTLCHFLLNDYEVTEEEIIEKTSSIFILRKKEGEYNKSLEVILKQAQILASDKLIGEEHIFMAILMNKNSIAAYILESLGLNIDDLIEDVKEIYDFKGSSNELSYVKNITKMAKNNELAMFIEREEYLNKIDIIMHRRFKSNPLLIGNAGVGKTALVEGYAKRLVKQKSDISILSLNLTSMLSGTRYRGDFEERFDKFINEIASRKNVIIFIDEIHTIMGAATTDGNLDVANMLKPFLARDDIKLIGATTLEEYHKTIENDKALLRRFQPVFISEPSYDETLKIIFGIKEEYEKFHNVKISNEMLEYLVYQSDKKITRRFRPDKCIDVLDDTLSFNSINNKKEVEYKDINRAIDGLLNNNVSEKKVLNYPTIDKYRWLYQADLLDLKPMLKIKYEGENDSLNLLVDDFINVFNLGYESVLEIDFSMFKEYNSLNILIGAPPGYVGYMDEGILSKHILEYPISIVTIKNFNNANIVVRNFIYNTLIKGDFIDQRGRKVDLNRTIFILEGIVDKKNVGFNNNVYSDDFFDEVIKGIKVNNNLNKKYENALKKLSYDVSFDFDINKDNKKFVDNYLYKLLNNKEKGSYKIKKEQVL